MFFGFASDGKEFSKMLLKPYQWKENIEKNGNFVCGPANFEKDPLPGEVKACFCDFEKVYPKEKI